MVTTILSRLTSANGALAFVVLLLVVLYSLNIRRRRSRLRPPGPLPKPLIGNLKDIPSGGTEWAKYAELARKYASDLLYFTAFGTPLLVLNSFETAHELLDKRGALYSDRPRFVMVKELMRFDWNLVLMSYGRRFIAQRRVVQQEFSPAIVARVHRPVMEREVHALLGRLLEDVHPVGAERADVVKHLRHMTGAIIMMVSYGHQVVSAEDEYVALAERVREHGEARPPAGVALIDLLPLLKYVPPWFPGAAFHEHAAKGRAFSHMMLSAPFGMVKERMAAGNAVPSMATRLLSRTGELPLDGTGMDADTFVRDCCGVVYSAGADTTLVALRNFLLAMMRYPVVQKRAQQELDEVVGKDRLPAYEDRARLPYVTRVVKESLRWKTVSNLGVPHATLDEDEYRGAYIPKGTTVLANIHAMHHDESVYANPDEFNPDRFLPTPEKPDGEPDPARAAFGFGRRICPGRYFAEDSLFLGIASLLHIFVISMPDDPAAVEAVKNVRWCSGLVRYRNSLGAQPTPFPVKLTPRSEAARDLVHAAQRQQ
ncbi:cytochrome P450 [Pilatotrama ljubarskyi]|nr:cytochrome P450 [Pilatotrama ljubarskyi]